MKKFAVILMTVICAMTSGDAFALNPITKVISEQDAKSGAVSAVVVNLKNPKKKYRLNSERPVIPASTLKVVTTIPSISLLSNNYNFSTKLYRNNNILYIKLGADPYLTSKDLKAMLFKVQGKKPVSIKEIYIDDSIIDSNEWGEGWQWDDDLNPLMPKFSAYNIDNNLINVDIIPTQKNAPADIFMDKFYPTTFVNNVVTGAEDNVTLARRNYISPDSIEAVGTVHNPLQKQITVNYPRRYFIFRLEEALRDNKIEYYGEFKRLKTPTNDKNIKLIAEIKHPISQAQYDILYNSNNMVVETLFKIAGGVFAKETGSVPAALEMINDYCTKNGIDNSQIKIVDASGVSKNNLVTAEFMADFLLKAANTYGYENLIKMFPTSDQGTLANRMLYLKGKVYAKTGTLQDVSALVGFIETAKGNNYAFAIYNNDPQSNNNDKKNLEEYILREVFDKL